MNIDDRTKQNLIDILINSNTIDLNDPTDNFLCSSGYFDDDSFCVKLKKYKENISVLSTNICSLNSKFDTLLLYLEMLKQKNCQPSVICLQETALSDDDDLRIFHIPNYSLLSKGKSASVKGGLATYVHKSLKCRQIDVKHTEDLWEGLFVELIDFHNKKLIIGNIYRPPRYNANLWQAFIDNFSRSVRKLDKNHRELVVVGDYNIDLLKVNSCKMSAAFFESICSLGLLPRFTHPTRIARSSQTLIDNALCRLSCELNNIPGGILTNQFSDHQPYFIILESFHQQKGTSTNCYTRKMSNANFEKFRSCLSNFSNFFDNYDTCNANEKYDLLHNKLQQHFNESFPIARSKFNKYKDKKNPWMTCDLLSMIKKRDKILNKIKKTNIQQNKDSLNIQLKELNQLLKRNIEIAKKAHLHNTFNLYKNDIKKHGRK